MPGQENGSHIRLWSMDCFTTRLDVVDSGK